MEHWGVISETPGVILEPGGVILEPWGSFWNPGVSFWSQEGLFWALRMRVVLPKLECGFSENAVLKAFAQSSRTIWFSIKSRWFGSLFRSRGHFFLCTGHLFPQFDDLFGIQRHIFIQMVPRLGPRPSFFIAKRIC